MDKSIQNNYETLYRSVNGISQTIDKSFTERVKDLGPEIGLGLPLFVLAPKVLPYAIKPFNVWQHKNSQNMTFSEAWKDISAKSKAQKEALKYLKDDKSIWQTMKNKHQFGNLTTISSNIPTLDPKGAANLTGKALIKYNNNAAKKFFYTEAQQLIDEAKTKKMTGAELKEQLKKIRAAMAKGDAAINQAKLNGTIKQTSLTGKVGHYLKKKSGYYKVKGNLLSNPKTGAKISSGLRLGKTCARGGGLMAVIYGLTELPKIIDSFKVSKEAGTKQTVKSGVSVATGVLGYAAGAAATGAVVGSVCPGIGNVAGAIVGFIGGCIGGMVTKYAADKAADKITGVTNTLDRSEADIAMEKKAKLIKNSPEEQEKLLAQVAEKAEKNGGFNSDEELKAYQNIIQAKEAEAQSVQELDSELPVYDFVKCF